VRKIIMLGQLDHFIGQQLQRPAGTTYGRARTGGRHQQGFLLAGKLAICSGTRLFAQRGFQVAEHEAALRPVDG
jgi:hypothetical protein